MPPSVTISSHLRSPALVARTSSARSDQLECRSDRIGLVGIAAAFEQLRLARAQLRDRIAGVAAQRGEGALDFGKASATSKLRDFEQPAHRVWRRRIDDDQDIGHCLLILDSARSRARASPCATLRTATGLPLAAIRAAHSDLPELRPHLRLEGRREEPRIVAAAVQDRDQLAEAQGEGGVCLAAGGAGPARRRGRRSEERRDTVAGASVPHRLWMHS